ncbi:hypothetical protein NP233_g5554 [Leucocoprinus birnbaumii]|uniref:Methyltransferase domain-containing protein n=1 Tax=Leucocoprinus birnbaumii TaxID=56174 RepID=A0AAD5VVA5_9AGAR|nr:hypothetical protein NP233_g5554 [Leucocoprinus birnbaumii]
MPSAISYHQNSDNESENGSVDATDGTHYIRHSDHDVDELEGSEFPRYFHESDNRLFHSSPTSPYPLPVDTPEQERLKAFNILINQLIGAHFVGPVPNILAYNPNRQPHVLDLCNGTGTWLMEIARQFPWVLFTGIDIVPIATRYPLPNVRFEIGDITEELRWPDASFDFIHARTRVMRPGGLYLSGELETAVSFHSGNAPAASPEQYAPASTLFFQVVNDALQHRGINHDVSQIADHLRNAGSFVNVETRVIHIPVGGWHSVTSWKELGRDLQGILVRFADSVKPMLRDAGHTQAYIDLLVQNFEAEMDTTPGMLAAYHIVQATRS